MFRNIFYFKYLPEDENFTSLSDSEKDLVNSCNDIISAKDLSKILDMLDDINQSIKSSPSQELKLELNLVRIIKPQFATDINSVSRTVDILESREQEDTKYQEKENLKDKKKLINEAKPDKKETPKKKAPSSKNKVGKKDIENFDVYWPKILQEAKSVLTPRKYSYLTLVKPEVVDSENLVLYIDSENEYLITELRKSEDVIELIKSSVAKKIGVDISISIQPHESPQSGDQTSEEIQSNINEIFDVESID